MGRIADRLAELELELPEPFAPPPGVEFPFDLVKVSGEHAYISGHLPVDGNEVLMTGRVGDQLDVQQGYEAARLTGLSIFASLAAVLGDLDRVGGWVKAPSSFSAHRSTPPAVINGSPTALEPVSGGRATRALGDRRRAAAVRRPGRSRPSSRSRSRQR
jgi:hypothetical protein